MAGFPQDNTSFIRAMMPTQKWAVRRAEKDQNLAYSQAQLQMQMQQQQQEQALMQQQLDIDNQIQRLPLQGPDKMKLAKLRDQQRQKLSQYIQENYKSPREFLLAEGPIVAQQQINDILNSDVVSNGIANTQNLALAMEARKKGEYIVGGIDADGKYKSGGQLMADFYSGKVDNFRFTQSYKPDLGKVYDHFGKMDNPVNKYDNSAFVPQSELASYLKANYDPMIVADMAGRNMLPSQVPYKRYSIQDMMEFNMDMNSKQMDMAAKKQTMGLNALRAEKLQRELTGGVDGTGQTWRDMSLSGAVVDQNTVFQKQEGEDYSIATTGKSLDQYASNGKLSIYKIGVPRPVMQRAIKEYSGLAEGAAAPEMILPGNGGYVLNLNKVPNRIVSLEGNIYAPQGEIDNARVQNQRADGFIKARIAISEDTADQLKLYNTTLWDTDTKKGRGMYSRDPKTGDMIFEGYVPVKGLLSNPILNLYGTADAFGKQYATEEFSLQF